MINTACQCTLLDSEWWIKCFVENACINKSNCFQQIVVNCIVWFILWFKKKNPVISLLFYLLFLPSRLRRWAAACLQILSWLFRLVLGFCAPHLICKSEGLSSSDQIPQPPHLLVAFKPITAPKFKFSKGLSLISWCNGLLVWLSKLFYIPLVLLATVADWQLMVQSCLFLPWAIGKLME